VFSDIVGYSKPSNEIFDKFYNTLINYVIPCEEHEVLHIGDSYECDYVGAKKYGFDAKLIETPQHILDTIKEINNGL
jgi:FMN phosphatase YigB (HAD superfamily)